METAEHLHRDLLQDDALLRGHSSPPPRGGRVWVGVKPWRLPPIPAFPRQGGEGVQCLLCHSRADQYWRRGRVGVLDQRGFPPPGSSPARGEEKCGSCSAQWDRR
jgi:hypothetical protein